jgi:hypothetical protein
MRLPWWGRHAAREITRIGAVIVQVVGGSVGLDALFWVESEAGRLAADRDRSDRGLPSGNARRERSLSHRLIDEPRADPQITSGGV